MIYLVRYFIFPAQSHWKNLGEIELEKALKTKIIEGVAKNVILFVGDGLGVTTMTTARIYGKGEAGYLSWEKFDNIGVLKVKQNINYSSKH